MLLNQALHYAGLGWKVIPLNDKTPLTENGSKDGSTNPKTIAAWWRRWPDANVAICTGEGSQLIVMDIDNKDGRNGFNYIAALDAACGQTFSTPVCVVTPSGGLHMYFKWPGIPVSNTVDFMGMVGIDIRGEGGYVVAPSSQINLTPYKWKGVIPDLAAAQTLPVLPTFIANARPKLITLDTLKEDNPIAVGERHTILTKQAGLCRAFGMDPIAIEAVLTHINETRCNPPLSETEIHDLAASMHSYPAEPNRAPRALFDYPTTDAGAAEMLAGLHQDQILFNHNQGTWLLWRDHAWMVDGKGVITQYMVEAARKLALSAMAIHDEDRRNNICKHARALESKTKLTAAVDICKTLPRVAVSTEDMNKDPMLLATTSGVVDLKTGVLRAGNPSDKISHISHAAYDTEALCPRWHRFLGEIFANNAEVINFVQRSIGYTLTGLTTEQCLFMLIGNGANGKSVFLEILHALLGTYAYNTPFSTFIRSNNTSQQTNDIAALVGRRLVISSETNEGVVIDESKVKSITGSDVVTARFLHQEFFEFRPVCKVWVAVNHAPRVRDDSDAFWRRVRRIDFPVQFSADMADKYLSQTLLSELPGILRWAVEGCLLWQTDGLMPPDSVRKATLQYRQDSDPLSDFLGTCFIVNKDNKALFVTVEDAYKAYSAYARQRELKLHERMSFEKFQARFNRDYQRDTIGEQRVYLGIGLNGKGHGLLEDITINIVSQVTKS